MRFINVVIDGFRCFQETRLDFPETCGLYLVRGENKIEPSLGANGAGKSTLFDSICWALYGKTARGLFGPSVESWDGQATKVEVEVEIVGVRYSILRTRKPIELKLDGKMVDQEVIDDLLGIDYDRFLHVGLMGQFGVLFPDLKPSDRLNLLDGVLQLDVWSSAAQEATKRTKTLDEIRVGQEREIHGLKQRLEVLTASLVQQSRLLGLWESTRTSDIKRLQSELLSVKDESDAFYDKLNELSESVAGIEDAKESAQKALASIDVRYRKAREDLTTTRANASNASTELDKLKTRLKKFSALSSKCPTCEQSLDKALINQIREEAEKAVEKQQGVLSSFEKERIKNSKVAEDLAEDLAVTDKTYQQSIKALKGMSGSYSSFKLEISKVEERTQFLQGELRKAKQSTSPGLEQVKILEQQVSDTTLDIEDKEVSYYDTLTQLDLLKGWPQHFKELRLWVVEQALDELTIHVNASLVELGLKDWRVTFSTRREGASKGSLEVLVKGPKSPERVPWESWSGGETQRVRVACAVGLSELIRARINNPPEIEVWDEPTAHLDSSGVADLISYFSARADNKQIWLVDHRSIGSGSFDGVITVVKEQNGSFIRKD